MVNDVFPFQDSAKINDPHNNQLIVEKGQKLFVIDEQSSSHQATEVIVHDYAHLTLVYDQKSEATCLESNYRFELGAQAKVTLFILLPTSEQCTFKADIALQKSGAEVDVYGLYVVKGQQKVELLIQQRHLAPNTRSNVVIKGILLDESKTSFNGTIAIAPLAHNSNAVLQNKNLVLSQAARAVSKPCLEVLADAVQCKHGTAIGSLDEEHLFYLHARGFSEKNAQKILLHAFVQDVLAHIPDQAIKAYWQKRVSSCF